MNRKKVIEALNQDLERELAEMVRYIHHSCHVFGPGRGPVVAMLRSRASDSMQHAINLGEKIASLGGNPTTRVSEVLEPRSATTRGILQDVLNSEKDALEAYKKQIRLADEDVVMDGFFREMIQEEQSHVEELEKLLKGA